VKLAVFDCDGTLSDGQAAICGAMDRAFGECGIAAPSSNAVRRVVGLSLPVAMRHLAPDAREDDHDRLVAAYKAAFFDSRTSGAHEEPLFAGIAELVADLAGAGWTLGVATGKSDRGLAGLLAAHGIADRFVTLQTADRHPSKPHPAMLRAAMDEAGAAPHETVMIGDTTFDIEMALAAGVRAIGVAWGYHASHELRAAGAEAVAESTQELRKLLDG
jgi:phosphoglycolate phosphatase